MENTIIIKKKILITIMLSLISLLFILYFISTKNIIQNKILTVETLKVIQDNLNKDKLIFNKKDDNFIFIETKTLLETKNINIDEVKQAFISKTKNFSEIEKYMLNYNIFLNNQEENIKINKEILNNLNKILEDNKITFVENLLISDKINKLIFKLDKDYQLNK